MRVRFYDVRATHVNNPDCPMRLAHSLDRGLYCIDCNCELLQRSVEVKDVEGWREKGWKSPLYDPDCPFALESDTHPK